MDGGKPQKNLAQYLIPKSEPKTYEYESEALITWLQHSALELYK
jgi:hypothetical protein